VATGLIKGALSEAQLEHVIDIRDAKVVWNILKKITGQRREHVITIASPGTLSDSIRSSKQSRDPVKTQVIYTVLIRIVLVIRVARTTGELIEIIKQL
jgi:hypothetical protein